MKGGTITTSDKDQAKELAMDGANVRLVNTNDLDESSIERAIKEYGQPISLKAFEDMPVGLTVQYRGTASKIKNNNGYSIELEDGAKINYSMFNDFGRIPHPDQYKDNLNEDHTPSKKDKYVVRPCKNKKEPWAVWEGEKRIKGFATKDEAKKYAEKQNKKQGLKEIAQICYSKGMSKNKITEILKAYSESSANILLNEGTYLVRYLVGHTGASREERIEANSPEHAIRQIQNKVKQEKSFITTGIDGKPVIVVKPASVKEQKKNFLNERKYNLENISPRSFNTLTNTLNLPPSAIVDVKIVKSNRPIFRVFFENEQYMDIIENNNSIDVNINGIIFNLDDIRDLHAAEYEIERTMQKAKPAPEEDNSGGGGEGEEIPGGDMGSVFSGGGFSGGGGDFGGEGDFEDETPEGEETGGSEPPTPGGGSEGEDEDNEDNEPIPDEFK